MTEISTSYSTQTASPVSSLPPCARIIFKLSGEWLKSPSGHSICIERLEPIARSLKELDNVHWAIVLGGGNIWRRRDTDHPAMLSMADEIGMMGTHINGLALASVLTHHGVDSALFTARPVDGIGQSFSRQRVLSAWKQKQIVILTGGLGHGGVSTDTTAVIRACELDCDIVLKGTKVDGVYTSDPVLNPDAQFLPHLTYSYALEHRLGFMDESALVVARQNNLRTTIISLKEPNALNLWASGNLRSSCVTA